MSNAQLIELLQRVTNSVLELRSAYGKRLSDSTTDNKYIQHARGKIEAYNEVVQIIKEMTIE
jgi:hypothetical protein